MPRAQPRVLARQGIGRNLVVGVRVRTDARLARRLEPTRKALRSVAANEVVRALASGPTTPSALIAATGKSKHALSQTLAALRAAGIAREAAQLAGDQRYRRYEIAWDRFGDLFLQDHKSALELYASWLAHHDAGELAGDLDEGELRLAANGRLLFVRRLTPRRGPASAPPFPQARIVAEFTSAFRHHFHARQHATLRDHLAGFYDESVRYADLLPEPSALGGFMRFQKASFQRAASVTDAYAAALSGPLPSSEEPSRAPPPVLLFAEAGREDAAGDYVLHAAAHRLVKPGATFRIEPSYVYDPPGGGSWT